MTVDEKIVVREFLFGEDDGYATACVAGSIVKYKFDHDSEYWTDIAFILNDGIDKVSIDFIVGGKDAEATAIRAKKVLDKVACVLRTLRDRLDVLAYGKEK